MQSVLSAIKKRLHPASFRVEVWLKAAVATVNVVLVIALAYTLARLMWMILLSQQIPLSIDEAAAPTASGVVSQNPITTPIDYAAIGTWDLFGKVANARSIPKSPLPPPPIPTAPLNLRLVGVFFSPRSDQALALIADSKGSQVSYRVGDMLPGGARLERIKRDHVIVSRNGQQEILKLPKLNENSQSAVPKVAPTITTAAAKLPPASTGKARIIDASSIAERLRSETTSRPKMLRDIASAKPYTKGRQFIGFQLSPGRNRSLFQQLGLQRGDVLIAIDEVRLSNPAQAFALLQKLVHAERISVQVLRNGVEIPLTFLLNPPQS